MKSNERSFFDSLVLRSSLVVLLSLALVTTAAPEIVRVRVSAVGNVPPSAPPVDVILEVHSSQPDVRDGLRADVVFFNRSELPVRIADPVDFTRIVLTDAHGAVIAHPGDSSDLVAKSPRRRRVVPITIDPGQIHRLPMVISKIQPSSPKSDPVAIPAGLYGITIVTAIVDESGSSEPTLVHMLSKRVEVRLGVPPSTQR